MKAVVLSAGPGGRLLPQTQDKPKCLLPVSGNRSLLEQQLRTLRACGVHEATVMTGFGAEQVAEAARALGGPGLRVSTRFNPVYAVADNLVTAWMAQDEMDGDFLLLNGDTLFEPRALRKLLDAPARPARLAVSRKRGYDADDMKVHLAPDGSLRQIGKQLPDDRTEAEAIGLTLFRDEGVAAFRRALEASVRRPEAPSLWYTDALGHLAAVSEVATSDIGGAWWGEVDTVADLQAVRGALESDPRRDPAPHAHLVTA